VHNTLASPKSLFEVIAFWTGECFGYSSIVCFVPQLRAKDLPSELLLLLLRMALCAQGIRWAR
jgi:hypothetical protein